MDRYTSNMVASLEEIDHVDQGLVGQVSHLAVNRGLLDVFFVNGAKIRGIPVRDNSVFDTFIDRQATLSEALRNPPVEELLEKITDEEDDG
jgi:hypothetical protein